MQRRELLALASVVSVAGMSAARGQVTRDAASSELKARLIHLYATPDGESRLEVIDISNDAGEIPVTGMTARAYARSASSAPDWHTAPRRQFAINMTGSLEVEISDGSRHAIGQGDLVFIEDTTGKGHVTRVVTPVTNLFIHVPQDWDVRRWARGAV